MRHPPPSPPPPAPRPQGSHDRRAVRPADRPDVERRRCAGAGPRGVVGATSHVLGTGPPAFVAPRALQVHRVDRGPRSRVELDAWIDEHWNPSVTVGGWWALLGAAGWAAPMLPPARGGRGATTAEAEAIAARLADGRARLAGWHRDGDRRARPWPPTRAPSRSTRSCGRSSPGGRPGACCSASPVPAPTWPRWRTTATPDGDGWRLDGRKTWATGAHLADMAIVLARTGPPGSRHRGLTCFALDMRAGRRHR